VSKRYISGNLNVDDDDFELFVFDNILGHRPTFVLSILQMYNIIHFTFRILIIGMLL